MKPVLILRHVPRKILGRLETVLCSAGLPLEVVDCCGDEWPAIERAGFSPGRISGLAVMGGLMSAYQSDEFPFLATEVTWLKQAVDAGLPTLGLCLGAQLLAQSLGARVYRNPVQEIGWYPLELLPAAHDDPLFSGSPPTETVFQWHGDTFDLPAGAVQLARSRACEQQAFRYGPRAYGLQFHLEMIAEMVDSWFSDPEMQCQLATAPHVDPAEIIRRSSTALAEALPFAQRVFGRFAVWCREAGA